MKNVDEIAEHLGISVKSVRNKISIRGISKVKTVKGRSLYSIEQLYQISKPKPTKEKPQPEVYYIYESKMNYEKAI